jgi:hypothetical protein
MLNEKRPADTDRAPSTTSTLYLESNSAANELAHCEAVIARGLTTFIEVGEALGRIRDSRLYRASHGTFDEYCRDRWGWTASRARQLMGAAETATIVAINGGPAPGTESQARELAGLTAQQGAIVMRVAHERNRGATTAAAIRAARRQPWTEAEITTAIDAYRIHRAVAVMPPFRAEEWAGLTADIARIGLIEPIRLSADGTQIIDGRFRYLALRWNGTDPQTATTLFGDPALKRIPAYYSERDIIDYIVSANLIRTHLTDDQRAVIEVTR